MTTSDLLSGASLAVGTVAMGYCLRGYWRCRDSANPETDPNAPIRVGTPIKHSQQQEQSITYAEISKWWTKGKPGEIALEKMAPLLRAAIRFLITHDGREGKKCCWSVESILSVLGYTKRPRKSTDPLPKDGWLLSYQNWHKKIEELTDPAAVKYFEPFGITVEGRNLVYKRNDLVSFHMPDQDDGETATAIEATATSQSVTSNTTEAVS